MNWTRIIEKYGWKETEVGSDPFHPLAVQARQAHANGQPVARVNMNVGTSHDFGNVKVGASVTIDCLQNDATISMAGECAFMKSLELVNEGAAYLGIPPLRPPS